MSVARWLGEQWPYLLGALGLGGVVAVTIATRPEQSGPAPAPGPAGPRQFIELADNSEPVRVFNGKRYYACVRPGMFNPVRLVSNQTIVDRMGEMGFRDVELLEQQPAVFPAVVDCWRYVVATWGGADGAVLDRPGAVELAWIELTK
jgi:hypothetical protein